MFKAFFLQLLSALCSWLDAICLTMEGSFYSDASVFVVVNRSRTVALLSLLRVRSSRCSNAALASTRVAQVES